MHLNAYNYYYIHIVILCSVFNIDHLLSLDGAIPSAKIGKGRRGWLGRGQTDGLHSSQIGPPNHGRHTYIHTCTTNQSSML